MTGFKFQELTQLNHIIDRLGSNAQVDVLAKVNYKHHEFPIHSITLGSKDSKAPVLAFFGGVHGLEKIGSEVILSYMETISHLLDWDEELHTRLSKSRLIFIPIVNPVGVYLGTRCNGNGVDLMRNSPVEAIGPTKFYSGQNYSHHLPWYRGDISNMEKEASVICNLVREQLFISRYSIALDLHSGFGLKDRLWFPYASRRESYPYIAESLALKELFVRCYQHHIYKIEPMCLEYLISGDLWDYLIDEFVEQPSANEGLFLPLTLEMGSWLWLRKNPSHLFSRHGLFHPLLPHRQQRVFRRHFLLFDFLHRCLINPLPWAQLAAHQKLDYTKKAEDAWYN